MDPPIFPVREQGPETGLSFCLKYLSKTCMDKKMGGAPTSVPLTKQQKRHPIRSVFLNGGSNRTRIPDLLQISPCVRRLWRQKRPVWA